MTDPIIFDRKVVLMQRAADFVRAGYRHWTSGEVRPERLRALSKKFVRLYGIDQTRHQRAYAKSNGDGCAVLLLYSPYAAPMAPDTAMHRPYPAQSAPHAATEAPQSRQPAKDAAARAPHSAQPAPPAASDGQHAQQPAPYAAPIAQYVTPAAPHAAVVHWILLVTPGEHLAHQLEHLRDATATAGRIVLTGYELVQLPRPGQEQAAWTWRMQDDTYQGWRLRLITAARRRLALLTAEVAQLARTPGFAGCRAQSKKLMQLAAGEWRRRNAEEPPMVVPRMPYVQRLPDGGAPLSLWLRRYTRQT
ncbi:hypothetical protein BZG29_02145 [Janthinobacterium sp. LM6]|uniref:hypothetical protein n=1 Tax=Janthinobacterium sp. LM6 TaxID=1938606 RepID=UPI00098396ED|nr:hypothetical protein [Janthinobacterium sp. LM6]AQR67289.1 hypothetical protein BZG29_02145 [Janthinobacterium sp. LM6]